MLDDYSEPATVTEFEGTVLIEGPGALNGAFTPDAAEESALRLLKAAAKAREWINPALARRRD